MTEFDNELRIEIGQALRSLQQLTSEFTKYNKALENTSRTIQTYNKSADEIGSAVGRTIKELEQEEKALKKSNREWSRRVALAKQQERVTAGRSAITSAFGFQGINPGTDINKIVSFDSAINNFNQLVAAGKVSEARIKTILSNMAASYTGAEARIRDAALGVLKAQAELGGQSGANAVQALSRLEAPMKTVKDRAQEILVSWKTVQRIFISQAIFRALSSINQQLRESVRLARDVEKAIAEVRTIAPEELVPDPQRIQRFTSNLSNTFGIDQVEVATALYEAFSNQVGGTAEAFYVLEQAAQFSKATLTDLADTQDLLSGVLNAYGLSAENARDISDQLFKTIDLGRVRGEEIANTYGRILPLAAQLGVGFDEVNAALATTTIQGVKADTALTQIQNIMKALIKPTTALQRRFDELGLAGAEAGIAQFGLVGFLQRITEDSDSVQELTQFFGDIRELRGVLGVLAQEGELFEKSLKGIREEAEGVVDEASKIVLETDTEQLERAQQTIRNLFAEEYGAPVVRGLNVIIEKLGGAENAARLLFATLAGGAVVAIGLVGGQLAHSIGQATVRMLALRTATGATASAMTGLATASAIFAGVAIGVYLGNLIVDLRKAQSVAEDIADTFEQTSQRAQRAALENSAEESKATRKFEDELRKRTQASISYLSERKKAFADVEDNALRTEENITRNLAKQVDQRVSSIRKYISEVEKSIESADSNINNLLEEDRDISFQLNKDRFRRNLEGTNDFFKPDALKQRVNELIAASQKAFKEGDALFSKKLSDEAFRVATQLAEITGQRRRGEQLLNQVVLARQNINKALIKQEREKASAAQRQLQALENQAAAIEKVATKFDDLIKALKQDLISDDQRAKLQKDLQDTGRELQNLFSSFAGPGLIGLEKGLDKIQAKFRDFDGGEVPLDFLIEDSLSRVNEELKKAQFSAPLSIIVEEITGIEQGRNQIDELQTKLAKLQKEALTLQKNLKGAALAVDSQSTFQDQALGRGNLQGFQDIQNVILQQTERASRLLKSAEFGPRHLLPGYKDRVKEFSDLVLRMQEIEDKIQKGNLIGARADINELINDKDVDNLIKFNDNLKNFDKALTAVNKNLTEAANFQVKAEGFEETRVQAQNVALELENIIKILKSDAIETGIKIDLEIDESRVRQQIESLRQAIQSLNSALGESSTQNNVQGRKFGGLIYRANGGWVPRGTDKVPAMLSPGEFVVNAASSRRFYSQLMAINAGRNPIYREGGGPVTNNTTNVGDISVNVTSAGPANARQIATELRRELRRNTSRF